MALKLIHATDVKKGSAVLIDDKPCIVSSVDISRPGKHGHAKVRIEAVGIFDDKKKVTAVPGHERFKVPEVLKSRAQILSISDNTANVMDLESYQTFDVKVEDDIKSKINEKENVEYWDVEGDKIIKRKL